MPSKKRKFPSFTSPEEPLVDISLLQVLTHEIDLEISLRQRLAATIESRVLWASLLQNSLKDDAQVHEATGFESAAMEAWDAIESPCDVIFSRVRDTVPLSLPNHMEHLHTSTRNHPPKLQEQPRVNRIRHGGVSRSLRPNPKLLFIRDATTSPPVIAKMACPDCSRDDFANIQGLLNHCRLRHQKDYGSHDECMQKCAVIVSEEESEWVLTNGQELGGVSLPSLRRLFEIAVGVESSSVMDIIDSATPSKLIPEKEITLGTHLARTLGHHKDTPALAPFLGRSPKRRCINVFDDHGFVDITGDALPPQRPIWRMPYTHRNVARPGLDTVVPEALPDASIVGSHQGPAVDSPSSFRTRFHIVARVVISDRSLWLPPERRTQANQEHTHRWMLSIDSPSYSLHITTFLAKMTVTCLTDPAPSTLLMPMIVTGPPFSAVGTTDRPFLARLTLEWAGSQNPAMDIEHWVELDALRAANPVLGDEQVVDVELDRNTTLYPIRKNHRQPAWELDGRDAYSTIPLEDKHLPSYIQALTSLLTNFPMTIKDVKGPPPTDLPYKLVNTPAQFRNLIPGRRKAIEWGRARALRDAYEERRMSSPAIADELVALTTTDIFRWLDDEGHFPRSAVRKHAELSRDIKKAKITPRPDLFCASCGLNYLLHPSTAKVEPPVRGFVCDVVPKQIRQLPVVDTIRLLYNPSGTPLGPTWHSPSESWLSPHDLVAASDPGVTLAIRDIVRALKLSSFNAIHEPSLVGDTEYPLAKLGATPEQVTEHLAPYALMSILTKSFIRMLIRCGLQVARHDADVATQGRRKVKTMLLTPSHISRGLPLPYTITPPRSAYP